MRTFATVFASAALVCGGLLHLTQPLAAQPRTAPAAVVAQASASHLAASVIRDGSSYTLQVEGYAATRCYLGFSLYTSKARSPIDGKDVTLDLTPGAFRRTFPIKQEYVGGTWAASLWQRKVTPEACTIKNDPWCRKNGFHMDSMVPGTYRGGAIR